MNITELGAIGELIGGVAVIVSLVFVGLQVRHSNCLAQGAAELALGHGILPEASWKPLLITLANVLEDSEIVADVWNSNGVYLAEDFRAAVNEMRPKITKGEFYRLPERLKPEGA